MTSVQWGNMGLILALACSGLTAVIALTALATRNRQVAGLAVVALVGTLAGLAISSLALLRAILTDDFSIEYVASYSEQALPYGYKLAVFWAGQAGSMLLWALMIAAMAVPAAIFLVVARRPVPMIGGAILTMALVIGFFAFLMVQFSDADPFRPLTMTNPATGQAEPFRPEDGRGLNPMLQDPAMVLHPPLLFLGYAGYTIPLALLVGGLLAGRLDNHWVASVRRWSVASWLFLGVGILLGSWWAYVELGWGGYWAWDPVENASLLPWFTGFALLHGLVVTRHRRMFKGWVAILVSVTFLLCIFGTYLTRSGVIQSVHSFGKSPLGTALLLFLGGTALALLLVMLLRLKVLAQDTPGEYGGREWVFFTVIALSMMMMIFTLVGTIRPLLRELPGMTALFGQAPASASGSGMVIEANFYNNLVLLIGGVPLALLMVFAPLVAYGKRMPTSVGRLVSFCGIAAIVIAMICAVILPHVGYNLSDPIDPDTKSFLTDRGNIAAGLAAVIAIGAVAFVILDFILMVGQHRRATGRGLIESAVLMVVTNNRRYGAQVAHMGIAALVVAIVASSLFDVDHHFTIGLHKTREIEKSGYRVTYEDIETIQPVELVNGREKKRNYTGSRATVLLTDPFGRAYELHPEFRRYNKWGDMRNSEVALVSTPVRDLYVAMTNRTENGEVIALRVLVKPMMAWLWIGGGMVCLGALICWIPIAPRQGLPRSNSPEEQET